MTEAEAKELLLLADRWQRRSEQFGPGSTTRLEIQVDVSQLVEAVGSMASEVRPLSASMHEALLDVAKRWLLAASKLEPRAAMATRECATELRVRLETHSPAPQFSADTLEALADKMGDIIMGYSAYDCADMLRELIGRPRLPPIPHPYGTYLWAREACARGPNGVTSKSAHWTVMPVPVSRWDELKWPHAAFIATDWEVVS